MHLLFYRKFTLRSIHIQLRGKNAIYAQTEADLQKKRNNRCAFCII